MIDLLANEDRSGFGIATALALAGIPYRWIARAEDFDARVLMLAGAATPAAATLAGQVPTIAIGSCEPLARSRFGTRGGHVVEGPVTLGLDDPVWSPAVAACARRFGKDALELPRAPVFVPAF